MTNPSTTCPGCGIVLPAGSIRANGLGNRSPECQELFHELSFYTLAHPKPSFFIHQYAVDAYAAQHAGPKTKPITVAFALTGLHLFITYGYSGREVQKAHMYMAKQRKEWPTFAIPKTKGALTVRDVIQAPAGPERDKAIKNWARSVWAVWSGEHKAVADLLVSLNLPPAR